jgi:hypothetical protein
VITWSARPCDARRSLTPDRERGPVPGPPSRVRVAAASRGAAGPTAVRGMPGRCCAAACARGSLHLSSGRPRCGACPRPQCRSPGAFPVADPGQARAPVRRDPDPARLPGSSTSCRSHEGGAQPDGHAPATRAPSGAQPRVAASEPGATAPYGRLTGGLSPPAPHDRRPAGAGQRPRQEAARCHAWWTADLGHPCCRSGAEGPHRPGNVPWSASRQPGVILERWPPATCRLPSA